MNTRVTDVLYDAIFEPSGWAGAMDKFAHGLGAGGCLFVPTEPGIVGMPASSSLVEFSAEFMRDRWYLRDPRAARGWPLALAGKAVVLDHDVATDEERRTLPYYQELLRDHRIPGWVSTAQRVNGVWWAVSLVRGGAGGPFTRQGGESDKTHSRTSACHKSLPEGQSHGAQSGARVAGQHRVRCLHHDTNGGRPGIQSSGDEFPGEGPVCEERQTDL